MLAEVGENCYIEPPFYSNWGGSHVHFGDNVYANFHLTAVDDGHIYVGNNVMIAPNVTLATAAHPIDPSFVGKLFNIMQMSTSGTTSGWVQAWWYCPALPSVKTASSVQAVW